MKCMCSEETWSSLPYRRGSVKSPVPDQKDRWQQHTFRKRPE
uniref:Uncharacterized protein n=1 Tax=Anguilla anguilla TaxID=7936 RepID=A0A0E9S969_ANGAN